jgi:hypothetical protein
LYRTLTPLLALRALDLIDLWFLMICEQVRHHSASMTPARQPSGRKPAPAVQRDDEAEFETDNISAIPAIKAAKAQVAEV